MSVLSYQSLQTLSEFLVSVAEVLGPYSVIISLISLVFGVTSTIRWFIDKRSLKLYKFLFDQAGLVIDKTVTEDRLAQKHRDLSALTEKIAALRKQIELDIPVVAKRAVLEDRLNASTELLTQYFNDVTIIKSELASLGTVPQLPDELLKRIRSEVHPRYLLRDRMGQLQVFLTIATVGAAISSSIIPYPFGRMISWILLATSAFTLLLLARTALSVDSMSARRIRKTAKLVGLSLAAVLCGAFGFIMFLAALVTPEFISRVLDLTLVAGMAILCILAIYHAYVFGKKPLENEGSL